MEKMSPPTSRLPPDGHEFPANYDEDPAGESLKCRPQRLSGGSNGNLITASNNLSNHNLNHHHHHNNNNSNNNVNNNNNNNNSNNGNGTTWRRDERSERSVRDKIALFTHDDRRMVVAATIAAEATTPASPLPPSPAPAPAATKQRRETQVSPNGAGAADSGAKYVVKTLSYSVDNLSTTPSSGVSNNNNHTTNNNRINKLLVVSGVSGVGDVSSGGKTTSASSRGLLPRASRSLLDVAHTSSTLLSTPAPASAASAATTTASAAAPAVNQLNDVGGVGGQRKTSLMGHLSESRRKSISKLRGLVIPDPSEVKPDGRLRSPRPAIIDLPDIISKDSVLVQPNHLTKVATLSHADPLRGSQSSVTSSASSESFDARTPKKTASLTSLPWKTAGSGGSGGSGSGVGGSGVGVSTLPKYSPAFKRKELTVPRCYDVTAAPALPTAKPPPPPPATAATLTPTIETTPTHPGQEESSDTDGDSALSSARSSFSQSESPVPQSAAVPEAPPAPRVLKAHSVEALNRKNVLQSARYSSGGGAVGAEVSPASETATASAPAVRPGLRLSASSSPVSPPWSSKESEPVVLRSRKAPDFEQTLKMFAAADREKNMKQPMALLPARASPASERFEVKTALITDVVDDATTIAADADAAASTQASPPLPSPVLPVERKVSGGSDGSSASRKVSAGSDASSASSRKVSSGSDTSTASSRKLSGGSDVTVVASRRNSNETEPLAKSSGVAVPSTAANGQQRDAKSFRALTERWEAIASDAPLTSGASSPMSPAAPAQPTPPAAVNVGIATPQALIKADEAPSALLDISDQLDAALSNAFGSSPTVNHSSRGLKTMAGVVEIRKAFERVREELETESNCSNLEELMGGSSSSYACDELCAETYAMFSKPHAIFSMPTSSVGASTASASHHHGHHARMSSLDSNTSGEDGSFPYFGSGGGFGSFGHYAIGIGVRDNYGSITSLASSTSLISPQELQQLLEDANQSLEESGTPSHEIVVVVLHRGDASGPASLGLGITLAGGADYETKEITVHKVISGSVADRDGRVQRGDRVLSINGKSLKGVTHREALAILKAPRPEVVLVLSRNRSVSPQDGCGDVCDLPIMISTLVSSTSSTRTTTSTGHVLSNRPPRILESPLDFGTSDAEDICRGPPLETTLNKDGAGLGFSLEGGKDSPLGDRPLTVKKIFTGGAASKNGVLSVGDQIISVNGCDVTVMSRIEAWNLMKKLPDGVVTLVIRQTLKPAAS